MRVPGVIHHHDAAAWGLTRAERRRLLAAGTVRSVGTWYVTDDAPPALIAQLAAGFRPTCVDAAALLGLWVPMAAGAHVMRPRTSTATAAPRPRALPTIRPGRTSTLAGQHGSGGVVLHRPILRAWPDTNPVPPLALVLEHAGRCLPTVSAAILFESALNQGLVSASDAQSIIAALPEKRRRSLHRIRSDAQSGTETRVRWWLESLRVPVRAQVGIAGVGRVDLLVGRSWVIECDSRRFHDDPDAYRRDRRRDLRLRALGYTVTRLTWEQVMLEWGETEQHLLAVLRRRDHRRQLAR